MTKSKVTRMVAFCVATTLLILSPAICNFGFETYLDVTMKSTGKLPTVKTTQKLDELLKNNRTTSYINVTSAIKKNTGSLGSTTGTFSVNTFDSIDLQSNSSVSISNVNTFFSTSSNLVSAVDSSSSASDYSSTNVQVSGIDEADILKNDGKYIYVIANNKLVIIEAFPAETMKKVSEVELEKGHRAIDMFLSADKLFLITDNCASSGRYNTTEITTKIIVFDLADRTSPKSVKTFEFMGAYSSSRMIDGKVYLFSNMSASKNGPRPQYRESEFVNFEEVSLSEIQYVPNDQYTTYSQIFVFDLATPLNSPKIVTYLGSSAQNVYMSQNNLYMAQMRNGDTVVYKFSLNSEYPRFEEKGEVPGTIVNQFAMDEYNGNFRIATEDNNKSAVYVLSKSMHVLGSVKNIARGEDLKSVRFEGERGYLVTFRNTDPLFVLDLSNARAPKMLGELKITGYSTYLHTYDENHVIGFGYDGTTNGTNGKLKIALFDITDVNEPKEKFKTVINASDSELLTNHKSLLFSKEKNLIAFSAGSYNYRNQEGKVGKVFTIDLENGFTLRGEIKHATDVNRMLFMDEILYGVSETDVSAHDIHTVEEINRIEI